MSPSLIDSLAGSAWLPCAVDAVAKATVLLAVAWMIAVLLHRSSAALRHRLWSLALCGIVIMPILCGFLPYWRLPILPATVESAGGGVPADGKARMFEGAPSFGNMPRSGTHKPDARPRHRRVAELSAPVGAESGPIGLRPDRCRLGPGIPRDRLAGPAGDRPKRMAPRSLAACRRSRLAGSARRALAAARARSVGRTENRRQPVDPGHLGRLAAGRALARVVARVAGIRPAGSCCSTSSRTSSGSTCCSS